MKQNIIEAIECLYVIEFYYEGKLRVVEPHCYGITTAGNEGLRAFQIEGYSSSGKFGWKMYDLGKAINITLRDTNFKSSRPGYKKGDMGMSRIYAEL